MTDLIKGPYTARNNGHYWQVDDENGEQLGDACAAMFDGTTNDDGTDKKDWDRGEAVAHLFAAAPELLEALRQMIVNAEGDKKQYRDCYKKSVAAVAKAEGRA